MNGFSVIGVLFPVAALTSYIVIYLLSAKMFYVSLLFTGVKLWFRELEFKNAKIPSFLVFSIVIGLEVFNLVGVNGIYLDKIEEISL